MRSSLRSSFIALGLALIAGCGFQLRGAYSFPYESIYISGADYALVVASLKRAIRGSGSTRLADKPEDAQAIFLPTGEAKEPIILSLSGAGRVREKRLRYRYGYRIVDQKDEAVLYSDGNVVVTWMDTRTGRSAPLPEAIRAGGA